MENQDNIQINNMLEIIRLKEARENEYKYDMWL